MAGTKVGGQRAAQTNKLNHGEDFYSRIGAIGGANGHTGGFFQNKERAAEAGRRGGTISKKGYTYINGEYIKRAEQKT